MGKDTPRDGSGRSRDADSGPASRSGGGKQSQGGESSRGDRSGSAQQEQGGRLAQQGGPGGRDRDEERPGDASQSGTSPRSRSDVPDEGKSGRS